jgi:DNA-binding NarL/FixJ family response regulator
MQSSQYTQPISIEAQVIIVDPHPLVREGLRGSLERRPNIEVVAEAGDGMAGLYAASRFPGAILLTNAILPDTSTLEVVRRYQADAGPGAGAVICHMPENAGLIRQFFTNCARGYIGQNAGSREFVAAIEAVRGGGVFMSTNLLNCLMLDREASSRNRSNLYKLTDREVEILQCLAIGYSNKEIANLFALSVRTVEAHRLSIRQKTGANVLSELVRVARSLEGEPVVLPVYPEHARSFMREEAAAMPAESTPAAVREDMSHTANETPAASTGFMLEKRNA